MTEHGSMRSPVCVHFVRYDITEEAAAAPPPRASTCAPTPRWSWSETTAASACALEGFPAGPPGAAYFAAFLRKAAAPAF